jgi:4-oxalmesaconate hydratase
MVELDVPAMIHVSGACHHSLDTTSSYYLGADTTAFTQLMFSDVFTDFPDLKIIIPHGGGAVPYHWGRFRGIAQDKGLGDLNERMLNNIYFDTCVYHQKGIDLLLQVIPLKNILFASEMIGAVRGIDPLSGHYYDDTKRYIDGATSLTDANRKMIFEDNARRVFSRLATNIK